MHVAVVLRSPLCTFDFLCPALWDALAHPHVDELKHARTEYGSLPTFETNTVTLFSGSPFHSLHALFHIHQVWITPNI